MLKPLASLLNEKGSGSMLRLGSCLRSLSCPRYKMRLGLQPAAWSDEASPSAYLCWLQQLNM